MTRADIPETQQSQYNRNFDFEVQSETGPVTLHGDYLQQGNGDHDKFIQVAKAIDTKTYEDLQVYFFVKEGSYSSIEFKIKRIVSHYGGEDHIFMGTPAIFSAEQINESNGVEVALNSVISQDGKSVTYSCDLPYGQFRFENVSTENVIYMEYFTAIA